MRDSVLQRASSLEGRQMTDKDFQRLGKFIESEFGIKMPPSKRLMLQARLQNRLRDLGLSSFQDYANFIFSQNGKDEILRMIDEVTTNKTEFFREPEQFDFLYQFALPELVKQKSGQKKFIKIWSAGCSTGEEPYSIAMVMSEFAEKFKNIDFEILGTDLSRKVLQDAKLAIYVKKQIERIPLPLRKKYLLKSKTKNEGVVRIAPEVREKVKFRQHNLMVKTNFMDQTFDIIFCRNVIIYFSKEKQEGLFYRLYNHLNSGGYLFLGHSETLFKMGSLLEMVKPKIYRKL